MVAVKVASLPLHKISVITCRSRFTVLTCKPAGVLKLSGETAFATASAVFASPYSSVIVACKLFTFQLTPNQFIGGFQESFNLLQRNLCAGCNVVSTAFPAVLFRC